MSAQATGIGDLAGSHYASTSVIAHAAATATEDVGYWVAPAAVRVTAIRVVPSTAATGDNTNRSNYNFINRTSGAGTTEVANLDFALGTDAVLGTGIAVTVTAFNLSANDALAVQAEKVGNGLALGTATVHITFAYR